MDTNSPLSLCTDGCYVTRIIIVMVDLNVLVCLYTYRSRIRVSWHKDSKVARWLPGSLRNAARARQSRRCTTTQTRSSRRDMQIHLLSQISRRLLRATRGQYLRSHIRRRRTLAQRYARMHGVSIDSFDCKNCGGCARASVRDLVSSSEFTAPL